MATSVSNTAKNVLCIGASIFEVENLWRPRRAHVFCSVVAEKPTQANSCWAWIQSSLYSFSISTPLDQIIYSFAWLRLELVRYNKPISSYRSMRRFIITHLLVVHLLPFFSSHSFVHWQDGESEWSVLCWGINYSMSWRPWGTMSWCYVIVPGAWYKTCWFHAPSGVKRSHNLLNSMVPVDGNLVGIGNALLKVELTA